MDTFGSQAGLGGIQAMGIINALKTGNVVIDMTIAMSLPLVISFLLHVVKEIQEKISSIEWMRLFKREKKKHHRYITHSTMMSASNGNRTDLGGGDSQNEVLIKAIQLYLDAKGLLKLDNANLDLQSFGDGEKRDEYDYYYGGDSDSQTTLADTLSQYRVVKKPIVGVWIPIGNFEDADDSKKTNNEKSDEKSESKRKSSFEVELMIEEATEDVEGGGDKNSAKSQKCDLTVKLRSEGKYSIDTFIEKAYQWYLTELRKLEDDSRYMYELVTSKKDEYSDNNEKYKRYQLSDEKTFESMFFQQKDTVLKIVDHFVNKTGKYAIKGYPHKLGLLLHGPPGTGKTSLIKALAERTGRSIVNVPLARISTNAELASIIFDQKYYVESESVPVNLGFKDVIFVMEDLDAVSKVVRRRDGKKTSDVTYKESIEMPITKSYWKMMLESTNCSCKELVELLMEKSPKLKTIAQDSEVLTSAAKRIGAVQGLSFIGEENRDNEAVEKISKEAMESAQNLMNDYRTVDEFLGMHAESLKQLIDGGAEVNEAFENELLGLSPITGSSGPNSFVSLKKPALSRQVSVKKYGDNDGDVQIEADTIAKIKELMTSEQDEKEKDDDFEDVVAGPVSKDNKGSKAMEGFGNNVFKAKKDELNLSGILNVLDGVVDTPGRMLVMTTNHPEFLDPALIRPGRIDKKLHLGYMVADDLIEMIEHYFQTSLSDEQKERVRVAINGSSSGGFSTKPSLNFTPAQVEQITSEHEEVEDMIMAIELKSLDVPAKVKSTRSIVYGE